MFPVVTKTPVTNKYFYTEVEHTYPVSPEPVWHDLGLIRGGFPFPVSIWAGFDLKEYIYIHTSINTHYTYVCASVCGWYMSVNWMLMHKISSFSCSLEVVAPELKYGELDSKGDSITSCKQACDGLLRCSCRNVRCWDVTMQFFRARGLAAFLAAFWITA